MSLRIVFMGTPDFAVPTLTELVGQGHDVVAVYTRAPAAAGRGLDVRPSPVQAAAERFGIPVLTPRSLKGEAEQAVFRAHAADLAIVVAYGLILPRSVLEAPALGCVNLHASLLPRWRGAAPIQRAIMAGDKETGVAVMRMEEGLDTGPVGMVERLAIGPDMTAGELHDALSRLGADLMGRAVAAMARGSLTFTPQPETGVTYAAKITNAEAEIRWDEPARTLHDRIRGLSPFPGAFAMLELGRGLERLKILRSRLETGSGTPGIILDADGLIACGEGALRLVSVQRAGKTPVSGAEFLRGARLGPGDRLALQPRP